MAVIAYVRHMGRVRTSRTSAVRRVGSRQKYHEEKKERAAEYGAND